MTLGGWICMSVAVGSISILTFWCCFKVLTDRNDQQEMADPFDFYEDD